MTVKRRLDDPPKALLVRHGIAMRVVRDLEPEERVALLLAVVDPARR